MGIQQKQRICTRPNDFWLEVSFETNKGVTSRVYFIYLFYIGVTLIESSTFIQVIKLHLRILEGVVLRNNYFVSPNHFFKQISVFENHLFQPEEGRTRGKQPKDWKHGCEHLLTRRYLDLPQTNAGSTPISMIISMEK